MADLGGIDEFLAASEYAQRSASFPALLKACAREGGQNLVVSCLRKRPWPSREQQGRFAATIRAWSDRLTKVRQVSGRVAGKPYPNAHSAALDLVKRCFADLWLAVDEAGYYTSLQDSSREFPIEAVAERWNEAAAALAAFPEYDSRELDVAVSIERAEVDVSGVERRMTEQDGAAASASARVNPLQDPNKSADDRALMALAGNRSATHQQIADLIGVSRATVSSSKRCPKYAKARAMHRAGKHDFPHGSKGDDGIEAWDCGK